MKEWTDGEVDIALHKLFSQTTHADDGRNYLDKVVAEVSQRYLFVFTVQGIQTLKTLLKNRAKTCAAIVAGQTLTSAGTNMTKKHSTSTRSSYSTRDVIFLSEIYLYRGIYDVLLSKIWHHLFQLLWTDEDSLPADQSKMKNSAAKDSWLASFSFKKTPFEIQQHLYQMIISEAESIGYTLNAEHILELFIEKLSAAFPVIPSNKEILAGKQDETLRGILLSLNAIVFYVVNFPIQDASHANKFEYVTTHLKAAMSYVNSQLGVSKPLQLEVAAHSKSSRSLIQESGQWYQRFAPFTEQKDAYPVLYDDILREEANSEDKSSPATIQTENQLHKLEVHIPSKHSNVSSAENDVNRLGAFLAALKRSDKLVITSQDFCHDRRT